MEDGPLGGPYRWMMILQCERATQVFDSVHLYTFCAGRCVPAAAQLSDLRSVPKASGKHLLSVVSDQKAVSASRCRGG